MRSALVAEYRKFFTTRMWWVLLVTMAVLMVGMAAGLAFATTVPVSEGGMEPPPILGMDGADIALSVYSIAAGLGYVFPVIIGAMSVTGEFRHQTITPTFLAEPRRSVVLGAKLLGAIPLGLFFGIAGTLTTVAGAAGMFAIRGEDAFLSDPDVLRGLGTSVVALVLWTLVGVGFGTVLKNQVASIVVILAYNQLVEPLLRILFSSVDALKGAAKFFPGAAADALVGSSLYANYGEVFLLDRWQGFLVLLAYGVCFTAIGRFTTFRKDIT
jgi:hypothetical protein